jgi:hypothetical protein
VHGTGIDGHPQEFWELLFAWTDDKGQIIEAIARMDDYGRDPWPPPPPFVVSPPDLGRRAAPSSDRARRNHDLALQLGTLLDPRSAGQPAWPVDALSRHIALFSPWFGERTVTLEALRSAVERAYASMRERLRELRSDTFDIWPAEDGWAWRRRLSGTAADGTNYESWEQGFSSTDPDGRIERLELYFDWQGFPQMLGFVTGCALGELWDADVVAARLRIEYEP